MCLLPSSSTASLEILYEDADILALNKAPNLHSVMLPREGGPSIAALLAERHPSLRQASRKPEDCGLIHRLDFQTSGVLVAAKTREAWEKLLLQSRNGELRKLYWLLTEGDWDYEGSLEAFIGSRYRRSKKLIVYPKEKQGKIRGTLATTSFKKIRYWPHFNISLVRAELGAGKRHQVRAFAAYLGSPLVGDSLYGARSSLLNVCEKIPPPAPEFLLHAGEIHLARPSTGERLKIKAPLPIWCSALELDIQATEAL